MTEDLGNGVVEFRFYRPDTEQLYLVGDFNGWNSRANAMTRERGGWWNCRITLPPRVYRFRYLCEDGRWFNDYASFGLEPGPFGWNSILSVSKNGHVNHEKSYEQKHLDGETVSVAESVGT